MRPTRTKTPIRAPAADRQNSWEPADAVAVFCRLRPLENDNEESCITVVDPKTILMQAPETMFVRNGKDVQYSFKGVFGPESEQKIVFDDVALPLVHDLLHGKNGLLFTYGVTGSGKTYTMQGANRDGGINPRSIDVIFNSIADLQVKHKFVFRPDRLNGFDVQTYAAAAEDAQREMIANLRAPKSIGGRMNNSDPDLSNRVPDASSIPDVDEDYGYSVFVSYIEIYNNYIYDLLDDTTDIVTHTNKQFNSKNLREDSYRNMFVYGVNEVEVRSAREALDVFHAGQKKRRVAETQLNLESSRSHSIFNIRLVQAPLDPAGQQVLLDTSMLKMSQLALVDLAGSERTNRTKNTGDRLREAGNINQSLMTLRACIEMLRENQTTSGPNKPVPYRDSKLTHLFRNYFEGTGKVKMIVCVNPRAQDYDENLNVCKFAEVTQEVQIEQRRSPPQPRDAGLTAGRRRANEAYRDALRAMEAGAGSEQGALPPPPYAPVYSLGPDWPELNVSQCDDEAALANLARFLDRRIATRNTLLADHETKREEFRRRLVDIEDEVILLRDENKRLRTERDADKSKINLLETRIVNAENANTSLKNKVDALSQTRGVLENELDEKELIENQLKQDKRRIKRKYETKLIGKEIEISDRDLRIQLQRQKEKADVRNRAKLQAVKEILNDDGTVLSVNATVSDSNLAGGGGASQARGQARAAAAVEDGQEEQGRARRSLRGSAVSIGQHRRSRSAGGGERWLDHRPPNLLDTETIMQPTGMKRRLSVTNVEGKDIINDKTAKYAITIQEQDSDGDLETKIYKGDVIPTVGGGRQVVLNDVEILTQKSPERISPRGLKGKRSYEEFTAGTVGSKIAAFESPTKAAPKRNRL